MDEIWVPVKGWTGYEVSSLGSVRSLDRSVTTRTGRVFKLRGKVLKQNKSTGGYSQVVLSKPGIQYNFLVHRLVAEAFIGVIPTGLEVCHNNGKKGDNRAVNLRIDSRLSNVQDCAAHGTSPVGERNAMSVVSRGDVLEIRRLACIEGISRQKLADKYSISASQIALIVTGKAWPNAGGPIMDVSANKGESAKTSILTESQVLEIRRRAAEERITHKELAKEYGVSRPNISLIVNRKNWRHI